MNSITKIKKTKNLKVSNSIIDYLDPDYIYIPIKKESKLNIKNHEKVYKGSVIINKDEDYYYSSVSGEVIGATKVKNYNNEELNAIVIENDFKEKSEKKIGVKKHINTYTKEELKKLISTFNASKRPIKGKILIVNGIDLDPFEENYSFMVNKYVDKILECTDALCEILKIKKCFFAIKNSDSLNVQMLINNIGTYPNIELKLMPDIYPVGNKNILIDKLTNEKAKKTGIVYFNVEEILAIYEVLKRNKPLCEKLITISGDLIEEPLVINAKIGTLIKDILETHIKILSEDYIIVANGLLSGHEISSNTVLTSEIKSIFITKSTDIREDKCINCGACVAFCPAKINPKYMSEKNDEKSKKYKEKCIKCGLCNFICPSKINLTKEVKNEKSLH